MLTKKPIDRNNVEDIFALTPMQQGMFFHYLKENDTDLFMEELTLEIEGGVNIAHFKQAWQHVVESNQMLRTVFRWEGIEQPVQIVLRNHQVNIEIDCIDEGGGMSHEAQLSQKHSDRTKHSFDLSDVAFKVSLYQRDNNRCSVVIRHHHILFDGWSMAIILEEFFNAYAALESENPLVKRKKTSFKEYIKKIRSSNHETAYWKDYLNAFVPSKNYMVESAPNSEWVDARYQLSETAYQRVETYLKKHSKTLASLLYTAWGLLLQRFSGANDVVFATTVSGREVDLDNIEEIVGLLINTFPLRIQADMDCPIDQVMNQVSEAMLKLREMHGLSLNEIAKVTGIGDLEGMMNTLVVIENYPVSDTLLKGHALAIKDFKVTQKTNFDLTVGITGHKGLAFHFSYRSTLLNRQMVEKIASNLMNAIEYIAAHPRCCIKDIAFVDEQEKGATGDGTLMTETATAQTLHDRFEMQVELTPEKIALESVDRSYTYQEVNRRANIIARELRSHGIGPDSIVGIIQNRSLEMVIGILGILKSGGAYLPIDLDFPDERIQLLIDEFSPHVILTHKELKNNVSFKGTYIDIDSLDYEAADQGNLDPLSRGHHLAYILYTSGSTGKPKGVMVEHQNVISTLTALQELCPMTPDDVFAFKTTYTFDVSAAELFGFFMGGGKLFVIPEGLEKDPKGLARVMSDFKVTHVNFVPSMLNAFLMHLDNEDQPLLEGLKYVMSCGEPLKKVTVDKFYELTRGIELVNLYGPTEATIYATAYRVNPRESWDPPIGVALSNAEVMIVDAAGEPCATGMPGELLIAGSGVARGYYKRADLTAERFIKDPQHASGKVYRTGDIVRCLPDGNIAFIRRNDNQIKHNGYRIELEEIERRLVRIQGIDYAVVQVSKGFLVAYCVTHKNLAVKDIRSTLMASLPSYMIPNKYVLMEALPLKANGKVDVQKLETLHGQGFENAMHRLPESELEKTLADIWKEVLELDGDINVYDSFFELGGHSLKVIALNLKMKKATGLELPIPKVFEYPTIEAMSTYLMGSENRKNPGIPKAEKRDSYPLSSAQKRMLMLNHMQPQTLNYNMSTAFVLKGQVDRNRMHEAIQGLIKHHKSLQTSFVVEEDELVQKVSEDVPFEMEYLQLGTQSLEELIDAFIRPFNLESPPLMRVGLIEMPDQEHLLITDVHHIVADGASVHLLVRDFAKLYNGEPLEVQPLEYWDYAIYQQKRLLEKEVLSQKAYWETTLGTEWKALELHPDVKSDTRISTRAGKHDFWIDQETSAKLEGFASRHNATPFMVLMAIYHVLLHKYTGDEKIVVGTPVEGRLETNLDDVVGVFINTLAIKGLVTSTMTFEDVLNAMKDSITGALANQEYPLEDLMMDFGQQKLPFKTVFSYMDRPFEPLKLEGIGVRPYPMDAKYGKFDIMLMATKSEERYEMRFEYLKDLFSAAKMEAMGRHFEALLKRAIGSPNTELKTLELLELDEKARILDESTLCETSYPRSATIPSLIEQQAKINGKAIAIKYGSEEMTYQELNAKANQLARLLVSKGVKQESLVALFMSPSLEMIVAILAVMKAGGGYLPIDVTLPKQRIEYMLSDSQAELMIRNSDAYEWDNALETIDVGNLQMDGVSEANLEPIALPENKAYIIYTSGSTGVPKGVVIEHRNVVRLIVNDAQLFDFKPSDVWTLFHSYSFDFSVWEIVGALLTGGKLVIVPKATAIDTSAFLDLLESEKVTVLNQTPSAFYSLIREEKRRKAMDLAIRYVIFGGEALKVGALEDWVSKYPDIQMINMYGLTETTVHVTYKAIKNPEIQANSTSVGKAIPTLKAFVLDQDLNVLPPGIPGELCVAGEGLAREYLNQPELTAKKFCQAPSLNHMRIYRSGDLAVMGFDGDIEYIGRMDHQVQIRGYRIENGEIENHLIEHPLIKDVCVVIQKDGEDEYYLTAFYVSDAVFRTGELIAFLKERIPAYMIPSYFHAIEQIPMTVNGKVDRKRLAQMEHAFQQAIDIVPPSTQKEKDIASMWEQVLKIEGPIGINQNFFEMGGHSLKATLLVTKILEKYNVKIPLADFFIEPTIKWAAEMVEEHLEKQNAKLSELELIMQKIDSIKGINS